MTSDEKICSAESSFHATLRPFANVKAVIQQIRATGSGEDDPVIGKTLGHCRIVEKFNAISMGEAYRASSGHASPRWLQQRATVGFEIPAVAD